MTFPNFLRRFARCQRGLAATETAIVAPIIIFLVIGVADTAIAVNQRISLDQGLRAGAQTALMNSTDADEIKTVALDSVGAKAPGSKSVDGLCKPDQTCATATLFCECSGTTTTCSTLCSGEPPASFVKLELERRHEALLGPDRRVAGRLTVRVR